VELQPTDHSNCNTSICSPSLSDDSDYDGKSVEQAVDLNACKAIEYKQKDYAIGMQLICNAK